MVWKKEGRGVQIAKNGGVWLLVMLHPPSHPFIQRFHSISSCSHFIYSFKSINQLFYYIIFSYSNHCFKVIHLYHSYSRSLFHSFHISE